MDTPNGHVLRYSDARHRNWVCINCGGDDQKGSMKLDTDCPKPVGNGGLTFEEWRTEKRRSRT